MTVRLEAIKFNHDPLSAAVDAINIRVNETTAVTVPEWQRNEKVNFPAAYALSETSGNRITIQAKFSRVDPTIKSVEIRAIDPANSFILSELEEVVDAALSWLLPSASSRPRNILGNVRRKVVAFEANGESGFETFELTDVEMWKAGVSVSTLTWQWQYRRSPQSRWMNFATSQHRIYTVLKLPKDPWVQLPNRKNNFHLPWAEVLKHACTWADGAQHTDAAAVGVTRGVRNLENTTQAVYDSSSYYSDPHFQCTKFLRLVAGDLNVEQKLNCDDFATVVSTFSNILGCELWQADLGGGRNFKTNPVRLFGKKCWEVQDFTGHQVAWKGACTASEEVFDASLEIDGDPDPTKAPHAPLLPVNMRFGDPTELQYVFRLTPPPMRGAHRPTPVQNRTRRSIYPAPNSPGKRIKGKLLRFLKAHYKYEEWVTPTPDKDRALVQDVAWLVDRLEHCIPLDSLLLIRSSNRPPVIQALFESTEKVGALIRLDIQVCVSSSAARHFLLQRLGQFQSALLERQDDPIIGDVVFVEPETEALVAAWANLVILVRNAGRQAVSLKAVFHELDRFVRPPNA